MPALDLGGRSGLEVVPKDRHRSRVVTPKGGKPFVQNYNTEKMTKWEEHVGATTLQQLRAVEVDGDDFTLPIEGMRILASVRFNLLKPASYSNSVVHATKKPDLDNLLKAIFDGLVKARVIEDDNCITDIQSMKRYADAAHPPGVEVELTCLPL